MMIKTWNAELYNENSKLQYEAGKIFIDELVLSGNENILDIGCGTGKLTYEIAKKLENGTGTIIGIDSSDSMVSYANKHHSLTNLKFIQMNAESMKFEGLFDVIISTFCIHWIRNKSALFGGMVKMLNKNGRLKIIVPFRHEHIAKIRSGLMKSKKWSGYFSQADADDLIFFDNDYERYVRDAGFDKVIFQTEKKTTVFEDRKKIKYFLMSITSHLECLPSQDLKDKFIEDTLHRYLELNPVCSDGTCSITYTYGKITAQGVGVDGCLM